MNRAAKKHGPWIASIIAFFMLGGVVYTGLGQNLGGRQGTDPQARDANEPPVARVGTLAITRSMLDGQLEQMYRGGGRTSEDQRDSDRLNVIEQIKSQQALVQAAKDSGATFTDAEIAAERDRLWSTEGRPAYAQNLELKPDATDAQIDAALAKVRPGMSVESIKASLPDDGIRVRLANDKLTETLKKKVSVDPRLVKRMFNEIKVRHILIKSGEGGLPDGQAKAKAEKILAEVKAAPAKMEALARQHTEDPGSKNTGGIYDWNVANAYVAPFSKGAFDAGVGKINPSLVKTQFGYHIIKLEGERPSKTAPKDLDKNAAKYNDEFAGREAGTLVQGAVTDAKQKLKVELLDPGLKAAQLSADAAKATETARQKLYLDALVELGKIKPADDREGAVPLRRGKIYDELKNYKEAAASYEEALKRRNVIETRILAAQTYVNLNEKPKAIAQLAEAEKLPAPHAGVLLTMSSLYDKVGDKAGKKRADDKAAELQKRQQAQLMEQIKQMQKNQPSPLPAPKATPAPRGTKK